MEHNCWSISQGNLIIFRQKKHRTMPFENVKGRKNIVAPKVMRLELIRQLTLIWYNMMLEIPNRRCVRCGRGHGQQQYTVELTGSFKEWFNGPKVCQEHFPRSITPPPPAWTATRQAGSMDSFCWYQIMATICVPQQKSRFRPDNVFPVFTCIFGEPVLSWLWLIEVEPDVDFCYCNPPAHQFQLTTVVHSGYLSYCSMNE